MRRRDFIAALGGAAAMPVWTHAQDRERVRRVGVFMTLTADDPEAQARTTAFVQGLQEAGWAVGRNLRIDYRWPGSDHRQRAAQLVALAPDVILAATSLNVEALQQHTRTIPIVFAQVIDPVSGGFVATLARPGGNITGFLSFEYSISSKWVQLLKEIAPHIKRVAVVRDPTVAAQIGQVGAIQSAASSMGLEFRPFDARDPQGAANFAPNSDGGLIVLSGASALANRAPIISLAAQYQLPAVYSDRVWAADGGLISYGPDRTDQYRRAAVYVDRILRGEKAADLPVQAPTKFELVINLKTAKAMGLSLPPSLLAQADEAIE